MTVENQETTHDGFPQVELPPGAGDPPPDPAEAEKLNDGFTAWEDMTQDEKLDYLCQVQVQTANNVQWLCTQLYSMLQAAEKMPFFGKALMKGM